MKYILSILLFCSIAIANAQTNKQDILNSLDEKWKPFRAATTAQAISNCYDESKSGFKSETTDAQLNDLFCIKVLANQIIRQGNFGDAEKELISQMKLIDLSDPILAFASRSKELTYVSDDYFFLTHLMQGHPIEEANGGGKNNTSMTSSYNELYYNNILRIFQEGSLELKELYLDKMAHVFRYYGYPEGFAPVQPLIAAMPDSEKKSQVIELFESYDHLRAGKAAPDFLLPDDLGKNYSVSDFKGKVVVIDVWGTWCSWCIKKMPLFLEVAQRYKDNDEVVFASISIDSFKNYSHWKYSLPRYGMMDLVNLFACEEKSDFMKNYCITGAPRYLVFDKKGQIVNVYTPGPGGEEFEKTIQKALESK